MSMYVYIYICIHIYIYITLLLLWAAQDPRALLGRTPKPSERVSGLRYITSSSSSSHCATLPEERAGAVLRYITLSLSLSAGFHSI